MAHSKTGESMFEHQQEEQGTAPQEGSSVIANFLAMARHPLIAKMRQPGKATVTFPKRTGAVKFRKDGTYGRLNMVRREDGTVLMTNEHIKISASVHQETLVNIARGHQTTFVVLVTSEKVQVSLHCEDLKVFLRMSGILPKT